MQHIGFRILRVLLTLNTHIFTSRIFVRDFAYVILQIYFFAATTNEKMRELLPIDMPKPQKIKQSIKICENRLEK